MGMGNLHLRKLLKAETMYKDKDAIKHKCNFEKHYILKVIDQENIVNYYNIMKCNQCLSFKSIPEIGNIQGHILHELREEQKKLPTIIGFCQHYYRVDFANLKDVSYSNKEIRTIYIPSSHKTYNVLPISRRFNFEIIIVDLNLKNKIRKLTNMTDHETSTYQNYESYEDFCDVIDSWVNKFPIYKKEILEYKNSVIKMNNKDLWAIVKYIGKSNWNFTKNNYYYVVMYKDNNSWIINGIIDNEEYDAFQVWLPKCTHPVNLVKDFEIVIDPSNNLLKEFAKIMKSI